MPNCSCLTAKFKPCKNRISNSSEPYNGSYMCFRHIKQMQRKQEENESKYENNKQDNSKLFSHNSTRCCSKTKKGSRCVKKTKNESGMCVLHEKSFLHKHHKIPQENTFNFTNTVCSPDIRYKLNNKHDNCYICLEETYNKLSCGHFIHPDCLLYSIQNSNLNKSNEQNNNKIFEHENKYFITTNCLYCKQIAIVKNIQIVNNQFVNFYLNEKSLSLKKLICKNNIKIDNNYISMCFNTLFHSYDTYENRDTKKHKVLENLIKGIKQLIFDKFGNIVFDNYIQQKGLYLSKSFCKISKKYGKIDKNKIMEQIENYIETTLYSKNLYKLIKNKLYNFFEILEDIFYKINSNINVQDEYLILMNVL